MTLSLTVLLGIVYPLAVSGASSVLFPGKAKGSLVKMDGKEVGSSLLGQNFKDPRVIVMVVVVAIVGLLLLMPFARYLGNRPQLAGNRSNNDSNVQPLKQSAADGVRRAL